jgi:3-hydroxyisobutyrate dehydrogenase-like beta-hydroxyacid dehydrogenase
VTILGLGAMGSALASTLLEAAHPVTVWNRTPGRDTALVEGGAKPAASVQGAVAANPLVVACLFDAASVRALVEPIVEELRGRALVNLTTTTPDEARDLAAWAADHGIEYLDGAIMAVPPMIGAREALILYSGSPSVFERHRETLETWATTVYDGEDAGMASLFDLAMLSGMYSMFAGFLHGVAMLAAAGVPARQFAERAAAFSAAMTQTFGGLAEVVDGGDYAVPGQSLEWTATGLDTIARASAEQDVDPAPVRMVQALVDRQIEAGHGSEDLTRIRESFRAG